MDEHLDHEPANDDAPPRWGSRFRRRAPGPPRRAVVGAVLLHVGVVAALLVAGVTLKAAEPEFVQYKVKLKSPPPQVQGEPEPVVNTVPVAAEPEPEPPSPVKETPKPAPKPVPKTQTAQAKPIEKPKNPEPARGPDPKPVEIGGENIDVDIAGKDFAYPEYLENISLQLNRYFRPQPGSTLEAEIMFFIRRDGSVGSPTRKRQSGNFDFDMAAITAVEQAGKSKAFGPLPDGLQGDRLWISFTFKPKK